MSGESMDYLYLWIERALVSGDRDWKRYDEAKRLLDTGLTLNEIGAALGVGRQRVREMLNTLEDEKLFFEEEKILFAWEAENPRPVEWWHGLSNCTADELLRHGFDSRDACMALAADELTMWRRSVALPGWEKDKDCWAWSDKKLTLTTVNEVRAWLGVAPYVPISRVDSLARARRLLERHGWRVEPPNARLTAPVTAQRSKDEH